MTDKEILDWMSKHAYVEASSNSPDSVKREGIIWQQARSAWTLREAVTMTMLKEKP